MLVNLYLNLAAIYSLPHVPAKERPAPSSPVIFFSLFSFREREVGLFVRSLCACLSARFERLNHLTDDENSCEHNASRVCHFTVISYTSRDNVVDARD